MGGADPTENLMTRVIVRLLSVTALAAGGILVAVGGATGAEAQSVTFDCTGSAQSWVVPANVTSATFDVLGAQGGVGDDGQLDRPSAPAGLGGHTTATIAVTPGETIQINVGCAGSDSLGATAPGGFGGSPGGNGGIGGDLGTGGGGGGSSDVRQGGTALTNRVVVAGGGGGSGGANGVSSTATEVGGGGDGGGTAGVDGVSSANAGGGGGGTQLANGAGGGIADCESSGVPGAAGTDGAGGAGGSGPTFGAGGGGGGGYRSGGGGAGCVNGGGGGGGAGFAVASATGVTQAVGVQAGDGRVVVTFTPGTPAAAPVQAQPAFTG
jgi:hypothetical protein